MPFSWLQAKEEAISIKLRRAKILSGGISKESIANLDFSIQHPDWVRDANTNRVPMNTAIKKQVIKYQEKAQQRRDRIAGK